MPAANTTTTTETLTALELTEILEKTAESHLAAAKRHGTLMIARTKLGNIELTWSREAGYGITGRALLSNKKSHVKGFLVRECYVVVAE